MKSFDFKELLTSKSILTDKITKLSDLLKPVTVIMSVTVLSQVVTGFVCTVTGMFSVTGCHGFCYISHGNVREMSLLFIESSRPLKQLPERKKEAW